MGKVREEGIMRGNVMRERRGRGKRGNGETVST
jgi:hypothetical protein